MEPVLFDILTNLIASVIFFCIGIVVQRLLEARPAKRLWKLKRPANLTVIAAQTGKEPVEGPQDPSMIANPEIEYNRTSTGLGEFRAMSVIVSSLSAAHKNIKLENILVLGKRDYVGNWLENDMILLGGPKKNEMARLLLIRLKTELGQDIVELTEDGLLRWKVHGEEKDFRAIPAAKRQNDVPVVEEDYGLIIAMANPFCQGSTRAFLFAGCHTYGTAAAASYFTTKHRWDQQKPKYSKTYIAIISCQTKDDYPYDFRRVRWWTPDKHRRQH